MTRLFDKAFAPILTIAMFAASTVNSHAIGSETTRDKGNRLKNTGIVVTTAEHASGRIVIEGTTARPGQVVELDAPATASRRSGENRAFRIVAPIVSGDCMVAVSVGKQSDTLRLSSCGPRGPEGKHGARGPRGEDGARGPRGEAGPPGPRGPAGPAGADGARGPEGPRGPAGSQGPKGDRGDRGDRGSKGDTGPAGPPGPAGPSGGLAMLAATAAEGDVGTLSATTGGWAFVGGLGGTVRVTITDARQAVMATGVAALGTTRSGGATLSRFNICRQSTSGGSIVSDLGFFENLRIPQGFRMPFQAVALVQPGVGSWRIGLCYQDAGNDLDDNDFFKLTAVIAVTP